jgi:hypothetical protein
LKKFDKDGKLNTSLVWGEQQDAAFKKLKHALINTPLLKIPDPEKEFVLFFDASLDGIGGYFVKQIKIIDSIQYVMNPKGLQSRKENGHLMRLRHWHLFIV